MKFNEYMQMKNFSEQQNFALKFPLSLDKAALTANKEYLKSLGSKGKELLKKITTSGDKEIQAAKDLKDSKGLFTNLLRKVKGKPSVEKEAKKLKLIGNAKNLAGKAAVLGTGAGIISIAALAASDKFDESKYYIFDEESQVILGSKDGYKTKTEALKVRDEQYPGERINVGKTLKMKAKQANFSQLQDFTRLPFVDKAILKLPRAERMKLVAKERADWFKHMNQANPSELTKEQYNMLQNFKNKVPGIKDLAEVKASKVMRGLARGKYDATEAAIRNAKLAENGKYLVRHGADKGALMDALQANRSEVFKRI